MYASFATVSVILATLASATPTERRTPGKDFGLITFHSGNPDVHLHFVAASDGQLFIGKPTASYCPTEVVGDACPAGNTTSFTAGDGTLGMNVMVPGGQQVFIDPSSYVGYTRAHSGAIPENAVTTGFEYTAPGDNGIGSLAGFDWTVCPTGNPGEYQLKAVLPVLSYIQCVGVGLGTVAVDGPGAWQYS